VFGSIGMPELIIGLVVILLLFGAKRVPELARGLGSGVREFKKGTQEGEVEDKKKEEEKKDEEQLEASKSEHDDEAQLEEDSSVEAEKAEQKRN
jgi:sec-independent protein translocase protein TatA